MKRMTVMIGAALAAAFAADARAEEKPPPELAFSIQGQIGGGQMVRELETKTDIVYGAILGLHFAGPLGLEVDYQHAENDLKGFSGVVPLKQDAVLGHLRFDFAPGPVTPFVYAGAGWGRYRSSAAVFHVTSDRLVVPAGAGLEFHAGPIVIGARGEYQWIINDVAGKTANYWKAVGTVGLGFP